MVILILIGNYIDINNPLFNKLIVAVSLFVFNLIWNFIISLFSDKKVATSEIASNSLNDSLLSVIGISLIEDFRRYEFTNSIIEKILTAGGTKYLIGVGALLPITLYRLIEILVLN
jgi:dolichol kinase